MVNGNTRRETPPRHSSCTPLRMWMLVASALLSLVRVAQAQDETFSILHFAVQGNTVLPRAAVEGALYPFMGMRKSIADVESARTALEQSYVKAGYHTVLVDIPEQEVTGGKVQLRVMEGRVERLRVSGSRYFSLGRIREAVPSMAQGQVPHLPTLEKELQAAGRQSADRQLTPVLKPGRTPGMLEAEIEVADRSPLHVDLEVNTRNAPLTSLIRTVASVRYDNLFQRFHSASLQMQNSPQAPDEVRVLAGTYALPVGAWRLVGYAVDVQSEAAVAVATALAVIGTGRIVGLRAVRPLAEGEGAVHTLSLGADRKSFEQNVVLFAADTLKSPVTYLPFQARYDYLHRDVSGEQLRLALEGNISFRGVGNDDSEFDDRRFRARTNFAYLGAEADYSRPLLLGSRGRLRLQGQWSAAPLINNEQLVLGGVDTVRGFFEAEALGDNGMVGSIELRQKLPALAAWMDGMNMELLAFIDGGVTWIIDPLPEAPQQIGLAGSGLGFRIDGPLGADLDFAWAWRLVSPDTSLGDRSRVHMTASYEF